MEDQRKLKRRELLYQLTVFDAETNEPVGRLVDITAEGLKMAGSLEFDKGETVELAFELPDSILGQRKIGFTGEVKWCRTDLNPRLIATGIQFVSITPLAHETIVSLMARYSISE